MSFMTIAWAPAESAADMPRDSGLVVEAARMTVAWTPMLGTSALDWDAARDAGEAAAREAA